VYETAFKNRLHKDGKTQRATQEKLWQNTNAMRGRRIDIPVPVVALALALVDNPWPELHRLRNGMATRGVVTPKPPMRPGGDRAEQLEPPRWTWFAWALDMASDQLLEMCSLRRLILAVISNSKKWKLRPSPVHLQQEPSLSLAQMQF